MSEVTTECPDQPEETRQEKVATHVATASQEFQLRTGELNNSASLLRAHIISVKEIISSIGVLLATQMSDGSNTEEMDGGVVAAGEAALIQAMDRYEKLLTEDKNWKIL